MKKWLAGALLFVIFAGLLGTAGRNEEKSGWKGQIQLLLAAESAEKEMFFTLTQEEDDSLAQLRGRTLSLGVCETGLWEENGGVAYGLAAPLVDVLHYEFGLEIEVVRGTWEENAAALKAGELDFVLGVLAGGQEETENTGEPGLTQDGLYCSAWLYENPYVLAEYVGEGHAPFNGISRRQEVSGTDAAASENAEDSGAVLAYVAGNPVSEWMLSYIYNNWELYFETDKTTADRTGPRRPAFLACQDEAAVFDALKNGSAAAGILPEAALFSCYPDMDFQAAAALSCYGSAAALATADESLCALLAILNRYLDATQEGGQLREAIRVQQQGILQEKILEQEQEWIEALRERGSKLLYAQAGLDAVPYFWHDESGAHGELIDFLAFVEECTGLVFDESSCFGREAVQALEDGDILFAAGVPLAMDEPGYCYTGIYQKQRLVPVVPAADGEQFAGTAAKAQKIPAVYAEREVQTAIAHRYWGVVQDFLPLLAGTVFDGHTVGFSDESELYEAMRAEEIGGMLIGEESFDWLLLSGEYRYTVVEGFALEVQSGLAFSEADSGAAGLFMRLWQFYRLLQKNVESAAKQYRPAYAQAVSENENIRKMVWGLGAAALVFAAAFFLAVRTGKKRGRKKSC